MKAHPSERVLSERVRLLEASLCQVGEPMQFIETEGMKERWEAYVGAKKGGWFVVPADLRQTWGDWLSEEWKWDWWCTMTFRDPMGPKGAHTRWVKWVRWLRSAVGHRVYYVRARETGPDSDRVHYHALIMGVGEANRMAARAMWERIAGFAQIWPYDPDKGATYYLTKYLVKEGSEIDFSPGLEVVKGVPSLGLGA